MWRSVVGSDAYILPRIDKDEVPKKVRFDEDLSTRIFQIGPRAAFGDHHSVSCALYNRFAQKPVVTAPKQ